MDPAAIPEFFMPLRATLTKLHAAWATEKLTPLEACLRCILDAAEVDAAIVGVNRLKELNDIRAAVARVSGENGELEFVGEVDSVFLDPRRWPLTH